MNEHDLIDIIGEADERQVQRAGAAKKRRLRFGGALGAVACFAVVLGITALLGNMGGSAGGGGDGDLRYMHYAGPVLPLTALGDHADITAARHIDFDFSPYIRVEEQYETSDGEIKTIRRATPEAKVTDRYELQNNSAEDKTLTLLYPFAGSLLEPEHHASVTVDGVAAETILHPGPYSGSFMGAIGAGREEFYEGSVNLDHIECFAEYGELLEDGTYLDFALDAFPQLDQPVTVYRLSDYVVNASEAATNPTLQMAFRIDYTKTAVLTVGMNGMSWNPSSGHRSCSTSGIEPLPDGTPPQDACVILVGEDIAHYTLQGYRDGGCDAGEEEDGIRCTVTRYETTLGEFLWEVVQNHSAQEKDLLYGLTAELLMSFGPLGESAVERYAEGDLETILSEAVSHMRVMYLRFVVTVPAGGSVTVEARTTKGASYDFYGDGKDVDGFDMATKLGTNLAIGEQTASVSHCDNIRIINQNFGFDLKKGITEVLLDPAAHHYWMEVRIRE